MLETWDAENLDGNLSSGRTHPLIIECIRLPESRRRKPELTKKRERRVMVVKALGLPEITEESLFREVFGNLLARELGLGTPTPALINLSPQFVEATRPHLSTLGLHLKPGIGVGCEYFRQGFAGIVPGAYLTPDELIQSSLIYAFDLLVQNPDRTARKPNCASRGGRLIAYDFEMSFSFLLVIGLLGQPWEVSKHGIGRNHLFYQALKDKSIDWKPFIMALGKLTEKRLHKLAVSLPEGWRGSKEKVVKHIEAARHNLSKLELELQRSLS